MIVNYFSICNLQICKKGGLLFRCKPMNEYSQLPTKKALLITGLICYQSPFPQAPVILSFCVHDNDMELE